MSDNKSMLRHRMASLNAAKDKENTITQHKKNSTINSKEVKFDLSRNTAQLGSGRRVLRSKSTNGLKVNHKSNHIQKLPLNNKPLFPESENANKSRKTSKQPISIFGTTDFSNTDHIAYHDSTTLQRSHSQIEVQNKDLSRNTLSRSSSAFGSSFGSYSNALKPKIRSKLTLGADDDMAAFFKSSKFNDQKQLGISEKDDTEKLVQNNNENDNSDITDSRFDEVTFTDDNDDITMMKKISTERNSPVYQRTHKVSIHTLLSSSTENDDIGETTFDYKDREKSKPYKLVDLESLMMSKHDDILEDEEEDLEIEHVSHNKNGVYDDSIPDAVLDGEYQSMGNDVLKNFWGAAKATPASISFKDPLELKLNNEKIGDDILSSIKSSDFDVGPTDLKLEFSDIEEEDEDGENDEDLAGLMKFYKDKSSI